VKSVHGEKLRTPDLFSGLKKFQEQVLKNRSNQTAATNISWHRRSMS